MFDSSLMLVMAFALAAALLVLSWRNPLYFLVLHVGSRVVLDSMPEHTYRELAGGITVMQAYSVGVIAYVGAYLALKRRIFGLPNSLTIGAIVFVVLISALVNQNINGVLSVGMKWIYVWLMAGFVYLVIVRNGIRKTCLWIWICLLYPLVNQLVVGLTSPPSYGAGLYSYRGSYHHESDLGFLLLGLVVVTLLLLRMERNRLMKALFVAVLVWADVGILADNYRTVILATMVFWAALYVYLFRQISSGWRFLSMVAILLAGVVIPIFLWEELSARFQDIYLLFENPGRYFDFSGHARPNHLLSGRIDIINIAMYYYLSAPFESKLVGLGAGRLNELIGVYAHNEYFSALIELGIFGLLALLVFIVVNYRRMRRVALAGCAPARVVLAMYVAMLVSALGTMPFRNPRAMMIFALMLGVVYWCGWRGRSRSRPDSRSEYSGSSHEDRVSVGHRMTTAKDGN